MNAILSRTLSLSLILAVSAPLLKAGNGQWTLTAWNNLGMHCMDDDYSVFSILPPFNTINAQVMDAAGHLISDPAAAGITVTYEAVANPDGSINTTALGKTNFYDFAAVLYGAPVTVDQGLAGKSMPGAANTPQAMSWDAGMSWFEAAGIPITPTDDAGRKNPYPVMRLIARNGGGTAIATNDIANNVTAYISGGTTDSAASGTA